MTWIPQPLKPWTGLIKSTANDMNNTVLAKFNVAEITEYGNGGGSKVVLLPAMVDGLAPEDMEEARIELNFRGKALLGFGVYEVAFTKQNEEPRTKAQIIVNGKCLDPDCSTCHAELNATSPEPIIDVKVSVDAKDVAIAQLKLELKQAKAQNGQLESAIRHASDNWLAKNVKYKDKIKRLKHHIKNYKRDLGILSL